MRATSLDGSWEFRCATEGVGYWRPNKPSIPWRPAQVPGCVHGDLLRCGVIADPFQLEHEAGCQWVGEEDWTYRRSYSWAPDSSLPRRVLRFEGLDTVCSIHLNGNEIARHDNMFTPLEIDVADSIRQGQNELEVRFESAVRVGMARRKAYFEANGIPHDTNWFDERSFVRKAQYMSGWDWGPRLVSCGIWRPVSLLEFESRIVSFSVFQERLDSGAFRVWSETQIEGQAALETSFDGNRYAGDFDVVIERPKLWWPNGEGAQHLYEAEAILASGDRKSKRIGLRTIELIREKDALGESFEFAVNGRRIYSRGANWIPNDSFPSRVTEEDYRSQVERCAKLGMNMLRVWGGGLYELDGFYDACDEFGVLVWQDFPYACSYYPDGPEQQKLAAAEAEVQVRRLRDRTCLALWCGNNENDVMWEGKWGGPEKSPGRYHGNNLYGKALADTCKRLDPNRPYIRSSPIGDQQDLSAWGDMHYWDVWHGRGDWHFYEDSLTRFSSEFGFACACGPEAWRMACVEPSEATSDDGPVRWHDKTNKPWEVYRGMVELHYPHSKTLEDWIYFSQLNQRDALRFGIEHYKTNGYCRGTLIWQFNDCWPVQSWAVQDYARRIKPAGFELLRLYAPALISLQVVAEAVIVRAANDGIERLSSKACVEFFDVDGSSKKEVDYEVELAPGARKELGRIPTGTFPAERTVICARFEGLPESATWRTLAEPKDMAWIAPKLSFKGSRLEVSGLAYDLALEVSEGPLSGVRAVTLANSGMEVCDARKAIAVRSMAGTYRVQ